MNEALQTESEQWARWLGIDVDAPSQEVCRRFEAMAPTLAPLDLANIPIYAVPATALPENMSGMYRHAGGYEIDHGYLWFHEHLPTDAGPGLVLLVDDRPDDDMSDTLERAVQRCQARRATRGRTVDLAELREVAAEVLPTLPPRGSIVAICRVLVHELGHGLVSVANGTFDDDTREIMSAIAARPTALAKFASQRADWITDKSLQVDEPPPQVDSHGPPFTRTIVHLHHRLRREGVDGADANPFSTADRRFHQRPYTECVAALDGEPERYASMSFRDILALPCPEPFAACQLNGSEAAA